MDGLKVMVEEVILNEYLKEKDYERVKGELSASGRLVEDNGKILRHGEVRYFIRYIRPAHEKIYWFDEYHHYLESKKMHEQEGTLVEDLGDRKDYDKRVREDMLSAMTPEQREEYLRQEAAANAKYIDETLRYLKDPDWGGRKPNIYDEA